MGITSYPDTPRLVNRFMLGADPEFVFETEAGTYVHAEGQGLTTLQGFGCDMAGRQAEIRAFPSRFALEVVASVVDSLRWMAIAYPDTQVLKWRARAYNGKDGCGGHIHFGRKRAKRCAEVETMDWLTKTLLSEGILNKKGFKLRAFYKKDYGKYSDIRLNSHGYEYRTLPTEMSNPWLMYFVLVVSKLSVYEGELSSSELGFKALIAKYKDLDDDAAIAHRALAKRGFPVDKSDDFKERWGVPHCSSGRLGNHFFPSSIRPERQTCEELFSHLTGELPSLPKRVPKPTWEPFSLSKDIQCVYVQPHTMGHLPDVGMDLVARIPVSLSVSGETFSIYSGVPLPYKEIRNAFDSSISWIDFRPISKKTIGINVPRAFCNSRLQCALLHRILSNTDLFPVCKAERLASTDWSKWIAALSSTQSTRPAFGRLRAEAKGIILKEEF